MHWSTCVLGPATQLHHFCGNWNGMCVWRSFVRIGINSLCNNGNIQLFLYTTCDCLSVFCILGSSKKTVVRP